MHRITDTKLIYILYDTGNEFTNYKLLCGNRLWSLLNLIMSTAKRLNWNNK